MIDDFQELIARRCKPCEGGTPPLDAGKVGRYLEGLPGWGVKENGIFKRFEFKNFYQTISFVNAVAWIAHNENHHPDMEVSYRICSIRYFTHAIGALSENDFICAAKVEALISVINLPGCHSPQLAS